MTSKKGLGETVLGWFVVREDDEGETEAATDEELEGSEEEEAAPKGKAPQKAAPAPRERGPLSKAIHPAGTSPLVPTGNGPYSRQADHPVSQPMESRALATRRGLYDRFA